MAFNIPILFLVFNRPEYTRQVFQRIREIKPKYLFVGADGPRSSHPEDQKKCKDVRDIILNNIDWECEAKTLFRDENLGCGRGPAEAISWFFENVEEGIVLEDDCLPTLSFFNFCKLMLMEHRDDLQIIAITGFNYFSKWKTDQFDYFFSDGGNWGWATWRRGWKLFDYSMKSWKTIEETKRKEVLKFYPDFEEIYHKIVVNNYDAWDIQWHYARIYTGGLTITPAHNLVKNIGFGKLATHTFDTQSSFANISSYEIDLNKRLISPSLKTMDFEYRRQLLSPSIETKKTSFLNGMKNLVKRIYNRLRHT